MSLWVSQQLISPIISSPFHDYRLLLVDSNSIGPASNLVDFSYKPAHRNTQPIRIQVTRIFTLPFGRESQRGAPRMISRTSTTIL